MDSVVPHEDKARLDMERNGCDTVSAAAGSVNAFGALFKEAEGIVERTVRRVVLCANNVSSGSNKYKQFASRVKHTIEERFSRKGAESCYKNFSADVLRSFDPAIVDVGSPEYEALSQPPPPPGEDAHALHHAPGMPSAPPAEALAAPDALLPYPSEDVPISAFVFTVFQEGGAGGEGGAPAAVEMDSADHDAILAAEALAAPDAPAEAPLPSLSDAAAVSEWLARQVEAAPAAVEMDSADHDAILAAEEDRQIMGGACGNCPSCLARRARFPLSYAATLAAAQEEESAAGGSAAGGSAAGGGAVAASIFIDLSATPPSSPKRGPETPATLPAPPKRARLDAATAETTPAIKEYLGGDGGAPGGVHGSDGDDMVGDGGEVCTHPGHGLMSPYHRTHTFLDPRHGVCVRRTPEPCDLKFVTHPLPPSRDPLRRTTRRAHPTTCRALLPTRRPRPPTRRACSGISFRRPISAFIT